MENPIRLHWLDPSAPDQAFPPHSQALRDPNGLIAIGGDLSTRRLLRAYREGIFPWFNPDEPILWWSPDPRVVLPTDAMYISRSLRRRLARADFAITFDCAPEVLLKACAKPRGPGQGTWLGMQMRRAYLALFQTGHMHTVEVWQDGQLAGGIYGVALGRMFFGESMFSRMTDGSKIAMAWLCRFMHANGMPLLDCQVGSAHLYRLGARNLPRAAFLDRLRGLCDHEPPTWQVPDDAPTDPAHLPRAA